jgi:signal transduction histidine kinase
MNFFALSALVNVLLSLVLGFFVIYSNWRESVNRAFGAFAVAVAVWSYAYFFWQIATDPNSAFFWTHILMAGAIFITPIYFHFISYFLKKTREFRFLIWSGYAFSALFSVINWTPLFNKGVGPLFGFQFWPSAGPLFLLFLFFWIFYALLPVYFLFRRLRNSLSDEQSAIRIILVGTIVGYLGGCTNYFLWYGIPVMPYGNISASIYLALVAYAITKHRLFNMKVVATEFLIFSLWLFIFVRLLLAQSPNDQFADGGLLAVSLLVGTLLIRSVDREVEQRERIEKQEKDLEEANKRQENLLHFISHEIKGYLSKSEAAFAAIIEGDYGAVNDDLKGMATMALSETRKGVDTVMEILNATNYKRGTVTLSMQPFDLRQEIIKTVEEFKSVAAEKHLTVTTSIAGNANYMIIGDAVQLSKHVFHNLIDNAVKYTPEGSVAISLSNKNGKILFSVKDSGVGVTEEDKGRLFTEGGRGKDSIKVNAHSTGYGLFIAKSIVERHYGRIWVESEGQGRGSTFFVELPSKDGTPIPSTSVVNPAQAEIVGH